ncbi:hypothetical protein KSAC_09250 [Komagataeibacter saccharivorans]|nr:hypothetical protein KSAC_09250 [Komagataeibacter saccharivorans]
MLVSIDDIKRLFAEIEIFRQDIEAVGGNPNQTPVSVEDMRIVASRRLGISIKSEDVDYLGDYLHSTVARGTVSAIILIRSGLPDRLKRAAFVKELCHLLFDPEDTRTTDVDNTVTCLLEHRQLEVADGTGAVPPKNKIVFVEEIASLSMLELLYPRHCRVADRLLLDQGKTSYRKVAMQLEIPEWMAWEPHTKRYKALDEYRDLAETDMAK